MLIKNDKTTNPSNKLNKRKGIILAGGLGTRLFPITQAVSKQLLPVYDKPMIYYPLSTLMLAGINEYIIITTPKDLPLFNSLLGDGSQWGISLNYKVQPKPKGIAQSFLLAKEFINGNSVALILGDNLFYGKDFTKTFQRISHSNSGATVFAYRVSDPERYGIIDWELDKYGSYNITSIEEKPLKPKSNYALTGLYFYDEKVVDFASKLLPSSRGELEITNINEMYLKSGELNLEIIGRGCAWLDTGTCDSLHEAGSFIRTLERRQALKIGCPEEVAWRMGWISDQDLINLAKDLSKSGYGSYLERLISENI